MVFPREETVLLRRPAPGDHGPTVFDAGMLEASHGILIRAGMPRIFDTHGKGKAVGLS